MLYIWGVFKASLKPAAFRDARESDTGNYSLGLDRCYLAALLTRSEDCLTSWIALARLKRATGNSCFCVSSPVHSKTLPIFSLAIFPRLWRVFWIRRDTVSESPVLTPMESSIDITVFVDNDEKEESTRALVDPKLPSSIISKALVEKLQPGWRPSQQPLIKDSQGKAYSPIGQVELNWHRKDVPKTNQQTFFVVDLPDTSVVFGANAVPPESGPPISALGLKPQTDGMTDYIYRPYTHLSTCS